MCGLRHEAIQRRLLSETDLTYGKAMDIASAMEAADKNTKSFRVAEPAIKKFTSTPAKFRERQNCYRCNRPNHNAADCRFKDVECHHCKKKGHIAPACRSKLQNNSKQQRQVPNKQRKNYCRTHRVEEDQTTSDIDSAEEYHIDKLNNRSSKPLEFELVVNEQKLKMELDNGAAVSIISNKTREALFPGLKLRKCDLVLKTYTEEPMEVVGSLNVRVKYKDQVEKLVLVVVGGEGPSLFGRNWLRYIQLDWKKISAVRAVKVKPIEAVIQQHQSLFTEGLGTVHPYKATLHVDSNATPRFFKPRPVPFAIKDAIGKELDRLKNEGIIQKTSHSEWAAPIVAVPKKDGKFRICGDYKVTINQVLSVDQYPLPKPEDLFATLAGGKVFTKLDLSQAYLQLQLDDKSIPYVTINTHQGLYCYTRLPFGVASAPAMFQKLMDVVLQGISGVMCYIDDILISSKDEESHLKTIEEVFTRLQQHGFKLKRDKCEFLMNSVEYLGHQIDKDGIRALPNKVAAIKNAPTPNNVQELRSFLGLINYYGKFIPNLATLLHPLNTLLKADKKWTWSEECKEAFQLAKNQLTSSAVLTHYNPSLPIHMAADASAYGVGAVISHVLPDGSEHPIAFASRTLSPSEKNYAQLEKEALSLIFGVKKFHQYLYGRKFVLVTDHKPLTTILGPKKGIPSLAAARLQRWAILLSAYDYEIRFKSTNDHCNADGLSRLPLQVNELPPDKDISIFNIGQVQALPVTYLDIQKATRRDRVLSTVMKYVQEGWPMQVAEEIKPYKIRQHEIGVEAGCLMWGIRVIIPQSLTKQILEALHDNHPGMSRMKSISRSYFWWSGLDKDIENLAKSCSSCQAAKPAPPAAPLHPWVWPDAPWKRVHIDFAGPFKGKMFFIIVDAHSKWPEVIIMPSTTSLHTIETLRSIFSQYGLPEQLVSDNGPQFTSQEFAQFMKGNGIKHIRSAPYHPSSNGLAERFVKTFKRTMEAGSKDGKSFSHQLAEFLFCYRSTAHSTTNVSPSELFLQRKLRTRFDLIRPDTGMFVRNKQAAQKSNRDQHSRYRSLNPGQEVMVRDFRHSNKWIPGVVLMKLGPVTYNVEVEQGLIWKRHIDQLTERTVNQPTSSDLNEEHIQDNFQPPDQPSDVPIQGVVEPRRYPQRDHRPPDRFM